MKGFDKFSSFFVGITMLCYGALLLHHANTLIRKRMDPNDDSSECGGYSDDILLEQGVALILVLLSIFVLNNALYAHFPKVYQKLTYLGDVHTKYGGHPFMKYLQMSIVLGFSIYFLIDIEKHKKCVEDSGGVGGEKLLVASNIITISLIGLFLLYKSVQLTQRVQVKNGKSSMVTNNPVYVGKSKNKFRR
jgi:hypothetical protein